MAFNFSKEVSQHPLSMAAVKNRGSVAELVILLLVAALFYWFILSPKTVEVNEKKQRVANLKEQSAKLSGQLDKLNVLVAQLDNNASDIAKLDESLPLHPRTTWVYLLMENMVASSGMTLSSLTVSGKEDRVAGDEALMKNMFAVKRQVKKMTANLALTGTAAQFETFLKRLENNARILDVKILEIGSSADELLDFRLSFDAYYFVP